MKRFLIALIVLSITLISVAAVGAQEPGNAGRPERGELNIDGPERGENGRGRRSGSPLRDIAEELGLEAETVREQRQNGATWAEILTEAGADLDEVTAQLTDQAETRINEALEAGRLTEEEAQERLDNIADRIDDLLNGEPDPRPEQPDEGDDV